MATAEDWQDELRRWLQPFLSHLGHKARRRMCPLYVAGLIGPGERKSVQPMASRTPAAEYDQLHHFVGAGIWDEALGNLWSHERSADIDGPQPRWQPRHRHAWQRRANGCEPREL